MQKKSPVKGKSPARKLTAKFSETAAPIQIQPAKLTPSFEQIAQRAYEIYVARGKTHGREMDDWIQAERELLGRELRNN